MIRTVHPHRIALAAALAALEIGAAHAQAVMPEAAPQPGVEQPAVEAPLNLDTVVVTGTTSRGSKMRQSVSISSVSAEQVAKSAPANAAEALRSIPGIRAESTGGDSNANINMRGLPSPDGGARYVQIQEDGLPVMLFGDIMFGSADTFLRTDYGLGRIEAIRGGSASTTASNAPGGIINFITKSGEVEGGSIGITKGLTHDLTRYDFEYGAPLSANTRMYLSGFYRTGETIRKAGNNAEDGGQIRAAIVHDLGRGGFVRLNAKLLHDKTPMVLPVPMQYNGNGSWSQYDGVDPRKASSTPIGLRDVAVDQYGQKVVSTAGVHADVKSIGGELQLPLQNDWQLNDKIRYSAVSGSWVGMTSPSKVDTVANLAQSLGTQYAGAGTYSGQYATTGSAATAGSMAYVGHLFNTKVNDLGSFVNDAKLSKSFNLGDSSKLNAAFGLFQMRQRIAMDWVWSSYLLTLENQPRVIDIVDASGTKVGTGLTGFSSGANQWGNCCVQSYDLTYNQTAPYASAVWDNGPFTLDGSLRLDRLQASGTWGKTKPVNYSVSKPAASVGLNFQASKDLAYFGRASQGTHFNADRLAGGDSVSAANGALLSKDAGVDDVTQVEGGAKWRSGGLSLYATLFYSKTRFSSYAPADGAIASTFDAKGLELESGYRAGMFSLQAGATYTKAKIKKSATASQVGGVPRRQADWVYQVTPSIEGEGYGLGLNVVGTTKSYADFANTIVMPGYVVANLYSRIDLSKDLLLTLSVNNLFNKLGITEVEGGFSARTTQARSAQLGLKYQF